MGRLPCIYCRRTDVPRTREHVLQDAFGATSVLDTEVCADCNGAFSKIDKHFVEGVRFFHTGEGLLRGLRLGAMPLEDGTVVKAVLRRDGTAVHPAQLFETQPGEWRFLGSSWREAEVMARELRDGPSGKVAQVVVPHKPGVPALLIVRSAPGAFLLEGTDEERLAKLCGLIQRGEFRPEVPSDRSTERELVVDDEAKPTIKFNTALDLRAFSRAMTKVALNFVALRLGPAAALHTAFDAARRFVLNGEGHFEHFVVPTLLNHSIETSSSAFFRAEDHGLHLFVGEAEGAVREAVFVTIKGKCVGRVDLTRGTPGLSRRAWLVSRFAPGRPAEHLTLPRDMPQAMLRPEVYGLQDMWPAEWLS